MSDKEFPEHFDLNIKMSTQVSPDDEVRIEVHCNDLRTGIAALAKVGRSDEYIANLWAALVDGYLDDEEGDDE